MTALWRRRILRRPTKATRTSSIACGMRERRGCLAPDDRRSLVLKEELARMTFGD